MRNILLIEDDEDIRDILRLCLEDEGYVVVTAPTAAVGIAATTLLRFDVVVLDLCLGEVDSDAMLEQYCKIADRPPVILISALSMPEILLAKRMLGAEGALQKPVSIKQLVTAARVAIWQCSVGKAAA